MRNKRWNLQIRVAGNTCAPCIAAVRDKGYRVEHWVELLDDEGIESVDTWNAAKDGRLFSATTPEELLGLIALWEARGDSWHRAGDNAYYNEVTDKAKVYDQNGNELEG